MVRNPLRQSINSAVKANAGLDKIFAQVGNSTHPSGYVSTAYRNTRRAMATALKENNKEIAVQDVLHAHRSSIIPQIKNSIKSAQLFGVSEAARQLNFYGVKSSVPGGGVIGLSRQAQTAIDAISARLAVQETTIVALLASDADDDLITGDENRVGLLGDGEIITASAFWLAALAWDAWESWANDSGGAAGGQTWKKQAVAALDNRTTDCCLEVHGQVQDFSDPFLLDGTPRYADEIDYPPFHGFCRTSVALYLDDFDDGLTDKMRNSADQVLSERADGNYKDRSPADGFV